MYQRNLPRQASRQTSTHTRMSSIMTGSRSRKCSTVKSASATPRRPVQLFDSDGIERTPLTLCFSGSGSLQSKPGGLFLDQLFCNSGSESNSALSLLSSSTFLGNSLLPGLSPITEMSRESDDSVPKLDASVTPQDACEVPPNQGEIIEEHLTEEMLDEAVELHLSETDTITLLDFLSALLSEDADDVEDIKDENFRYAELCKNRRGNDKYMARSAQTFNGALKEKEIQTDKIVMVDEASAATISCIYDSLSDPFETPQSKKADHQKSNVNSQESRVDKNSSGSYTGSSTTSPSENEWYVNSFNNESDPNLILNSEALHQSFLMMERVIMASIFQPRLAAYRQLPILPDPDSKVEPKMEEQKDDEEESSLHATLERLWVFSCELTRGWNITSMALNKKDPDIMAVGYSDFSYGNWTPGLICCWSLKSLKWPEKVFHCDSGVTALDFSINNPSQLAVGMLNGTMAIYNILIHNNFACIANSNECPNKHLHAVWQIRWTQEERAVLSSEDKAEALVSVSADGRITKWIFCTNGLYSTDLMKLQRLKKIENNKSPVEETENEDNLLPTPIPGLCFDFHPRDPSIYLTGTWEGQIHKCSVSNNQFLQTYEHHFCPVNSVQWSPFHPDMFLSCSSDWTIQLWKQDRLTPLLSFPCTHRDVYAIRWSPDCSTIFAAIDEQQMEIWDLKSSLLAPTIVHHMAPGVRMTALLFARGTNCVLVGDSEGQVSVYQLKNLSVKEDMQAESLEDIIQSILSRTL